ncbi:MFS transporter [Sphaerisporangium sp. TRM90804]|uniref:MFS transporter n=1 Tax=Sphaerisporangium sp. TRM90804 TaxID=3031113 RepID=UPI0024469D4C|nr:MFS transporter [Sphaerisporangium sp. TRM90804]MDH2424457.1 MFS transporter [Sphaerisporangium sp. TRM90804]
MRSDTSWRTPDFRALFTATVFNQLGTNIGYVAIPLIAVSALNAGPGQVGVLATLTTVSFLLIGLPAGAWVDRMRHRRVLITADLTRAALFTSVPVLWALDALTIEYLYVMVLLNGCATVFLEVGSQTILPQLVGHDGLVRANASVISIMAFGNVAGRGAGGGLVQLLGAPVAVVCTAASYLASALRLTGIRASGEPAPPDPGRPVRLGAQIAEGVRHVFGDRELRALVLTGALINLGVQIVNTMLPVLFVREIDLSAGVLGLFWAGGGVGLFLGSRFARPIAGRLGFGRSLGIVGLCLAPAGLLVPLVDQGPWLWVAGAGWLLATFKTGMDNVLGVSLRQALTPAPLLGRMNATFRFLLTGAHAVGAALSGLIGELVSVRAALWTGGVVLSLAFLPVFLSPVRARREMPRQPEAEPVRRPA